MQVTLKVFKKVKHCPNFFQKFYSFEQYCRTAWIIHSNQYWKLHEDLMNMNDEKKTRFNIIDYFSFFFIFWQSTCNFKMIPVLLRHEFQHWYEIIFLLDRKVWFLSTLFDDRKVCAISRDLIAGRISCLDSTNWNYRAFIFETEFVFNMQWFSIFKQEIFDLNEWQKCVPKSCVSISKVKELFFHKLQNWRALWSNFFQYSYKAYRTIYLRYL